MFLRNLSLPRIIVRLYSGSKKSPPKLKHSKNSTLRKSSILRKGSTLKKKKSNNNKKKKNGELESNNHFHTYGVYGGLKKWENIKSPPSILNKITQFKELKILPTVAEVSEEIIRQESIVKDIDNPKVFEVKPSPIQILAIKELSSSLMDKKLHTYALAAETGSGKTLAYLMPLFDFLKRCEIEIENETTIKNVPGIKSVILVPTHELASQVYDTVIKGSGPLGLSIFKWDGNQLSYDELAAKFQERIDILITTPSKLDSLSRIRKIHRPDKLINQIEFLIVDEADTLFDKSWIDITYKCLISMKNLRQLVFTSATIPFEFNKTLTKIFPDLNIITTPRLHKLPSSIIIKLIDSSLKPFSGSKIKTIAQILFAISSDNTEPGYEKRCIVFVNENRDIPKLVDELKERFKYNIIGLTGNDSIEERLIKIKDFIEPPKRITEEAIANTDTYDGINSLRSVKPLKVLVTSDLLARGINFKGVKNVILYDIPKTSVDVIHRIGRTGRMKQRGRVFMIIDNKTKSWAKALPKVIRKNITLG
ncbi:hypothetical protein TBLA_0A06180 [Henningerozyma blattae CBS 6284]|uniref:ATP-dependent RNA helicase n=1 Tax=Henningerozyma blattae (strain ATCC 34711 / CBS 6284 / DSM 70876 / NBRC 10599 / NRRL Y-10934 / UCD 77-7) TaxID=1071380 RepID=I2GWA8_HENB6|nr:hypothetical protein TBLA_0A06180 [Tetrapisispora blattae CBS 6284]CCH58410.1 hypothetical protein TBLA_0A06180 [Tetrapisispora blattae CBS 6284]